MVFSPVVGIAGDRVTTERRDGVFAFVRSTFCTLRFGEQELHEVEHFRLRAFGKALHALIDAVGDGHAEKGLRKTEQNVSNVSVLRNDP